MLLKLQQIQNNVSGPVLYYQDKIRIPLHLIMVMVDLFEASFSGYGINADQFSPNKFIQFNKIEKLEKRLHS